MVATASARLDIRLRSEGVREDENPMEVFSIAERRSLFCWEGISVSMLLLLCWVMVVSLFGVMETTVVSIMSSLLVVYRRIIERSLVVVEGNVGFEHRFGLLKLPKHALL